MELAIIILGACLLVLEIICILKISNAKQKNPEELAETRELIKSMRESQNALKIDVIQKISEGQVQIQMQTQESLRKGLRDIQGALESSMIKFQESTEKRLNDNTATVGRTISEGLNTIQQTTEKKLTDIQSNVDAKLEKNLNERLDQSFKQVGERLESLYRSLGELKSLESGVTNLNKTLSNVKARGIYGELALGNILSNILDKGQYDTNVPIRPRTGERVEFAVKIPDKENSGYIYLPIDSKFPSDIYGKVLEAAENADAVLLKSAVDELKVRIRKEAMTIRDKYIYPPHTTDFAILFLPTEGLYSEVLRIDGLVEECQEKYKIVISGPTTLSALLNSLSVGFKYLTVNKKSEEIMKLLGNFKRQFEKFNDLISETQKKISGAQEAARKLQERSGMIQGKLDRVELVEYGEETKLEDEMSDK